MEMFYPVDLVVNNGDMVRLPVGEVTELFIQFNVNHNDSEFKNTWFEELEHSEMTREVPEEELILSEMGD